MSRLRSAIRAVMLGAFALVLAAIAPADAPAAAAAPEPETVASLAEVRIVPPQPTIALDATNASTPRSSLWHGPDSTDAEVSTPPRVAAEDALARWFAAIGAPDPRRIEALAHVQETVWIFAGLGLALVVAGFAFLVRSRPARGVATFHLAFPANVEGDFQIGLQRRASRWLGFGRAARKQIRLRPGSPHTRSGVRRETQFEGLAPGQWSALVEGVLTAPRSGAELVRVHEEVEFEIFADETTPVRIDLPEIEVRVELRVHWDLQPARDVGVCLRGRPDTLRYSGHGRSRISLPVGTHEILIGAGDRVVSRVLELEDYEPFQTDVDLATSEGAVFKGCPPAVTSCLQGDLRGAARSLTRDGQSDVASLLLAELHQSEGHVEAAAIALEEAGRPVEAANLRRTMKDHRAAAVLYETAGDRASAAEMYVAAGLWAEAGRVYESLEAWEQAANAFATAGDRAGQIRALESQGEHLRAAGLAAEIDDRARAIRLLQQVAPHESDYGQASELLVLAYEQEGHLDLAAHQLERRLEFLPVGETAPDLEFHLAELLEELGEDERALDVLEVLRDREPTYPKVATRIEGLRKKLSASLRQGATATFASVPGATAFVTKARYELLEEIGSGGMGRVYKARDRRLGRDVALKRMPENLRDHPTAVSLFLGEAQAAARMNHPNIVTVYDADQEQGHFFITMELLNGLPLHTILKEHGPFDAADTARLGLQACAGLTYAHAQGIVHRDIKTANFFITNERSLKIMDFGLAKMVQAVRDQDATLIAGTPLYMAPEQATGNVVDGRTDLYGLGVTLFELSTGRLPFFEGDVAEQHRLAEPPDPTSLVDDYPPALASLVLRLLSKRPEDRPASAAEVATELSSILDLLMSQGTSA